MGSFLLHVCTVRADKKKLERLIKQVNCYHNLFKGNFLKETAALPSKLEESIKTQREKCTVLS
jgi:hypothetical protein